MRIAVNARFLLTGRLEGIGGYTYQVTRRMVAAQPEHTFILLFDRKPDPEFIFGPNVLPVVVQPPARHPLLWWWWFEVGVPRALRQHKADVFLSPDGYCSLRSRVPTLMVTHDIAHVHYPGQIPWLVRQYYQYFVPRYLERAERIAVVSHFSKEDIIRHYQIPEERLIVAGNGCRDIFRPLPGDKQQRIRQEYAQGQPYFFYVGAMHPRKNVDGLIRAFDRFKQQTEAPVKLLLSGRLAWQGNEIKKAWADTQYKQDVIWLGYVADERLPELMGSALALTYISWMEGFGVPLLEAMHAEVPVITSNVSALPEVTGDAALLVDPASLTDIAQAMEKIYSRPDIRRRLVNLGRKQRKQYSWDQTADRIWKVLLQLL